MSAGLNAHSSHCRATQRNSFTVECKNSIDFLISADRMDTAVAHPERSLNSGAIRRIKILKDDAQRDCGCFPGRCRPDTWLGGSGGGNDKRERDGQDS